MRTTNFVDHIAYLHYRIEHSEKASQQVLISFLLHSVEMSNFKEQHLNNLTLDFRQNKTTAASVVVFIHRFLFMKRSKLKWIISCETNR